MTDLINKIGRAAVEGTGSTDSSQDTKTGNIPPLHVSAQNRGDNLINDAGKKPVQTEQVSTTAAPGQTQKEESSSSVVNDPDSWSKESALKEMKKAREEAKAHRVKYEEQVQKLRDEAEARISAVKAEQEDLRKAADELTKLKADQEDRKRDLAEKVAHRQAQVDQLQAQLAIKDQTFREEQEKLKSKLNRYEAEAQAQLKVYEQRLTTELDNVPEKFKEIASYIVKGAGDPRDALVALNEAKIKGLFEEKTVVVNHSVPGAQDGARATKERLDAGAADARAKMTSQQKIGQALKSMKDTPNSAFRIR
jgi:chromosome segregation ATPase